jgi:WD40 repeat protein
MTVRVWNAAIGSRLSTYHGYASQLCNVAWSPDSEGLASGDFDKKLQVWEAI